MPVFLSFLILVSSLSPYWAHVFLPFLILVSSLSPCRAHDFFSSSNLVSVGSEGGNKWKEKTEEEKKGGDEGG